MFRQDGVLYRQINEPYRESYRRLISSGLLEELVAGGLLVGAPEARSEGCGPAVAFLRPEVVTFVSYPYEWSFSELKDAALLTLEVQRRALLRDMSLRDASAYNVQFRRGSPILIDTLSFEPYEEGSPWVAYRQFCRHFLAPLALMSKVDVRLSCLLREYIDGVPLNLASRLLPAATRLRPGLLAHIHLHGKAEVRSAPVSEGSRATMSKTAMFGLIDSLKGTIDGLSWRPEGTEWADYYADTNYTPAAMQEKRRLVRQAIEELDPKPNTCWDLGANTGEFSRIAASCGIETIAWDGDPAAVEKAYLAGRTSGEERVLPLLQDLANPSPDIGWASEERDGLMPRGPADLILALALIHHLAIGNSVPLDMIAGFLARIGRAAIVEFVPKEDSQVQRLLTSRKDVFDSYSEEVWEATASKRFVIQSKHPLPESRRILYVLRRAEVGA